MKFLRVIFNAAVLLLATTAYADAGPLVQAVIGFVFGAGFAASTIGKLLILGLTAVLQLGVSLLMKALQKKDKPKDPGVKFETEIGDDNPIAFPMGTYATAGSRVYDGTWGTVGETPNAYLVDVIQFSDIPGDLSALWVSGKKVTLDGTADPDLGFPVLEYRRNGKDFMWVRIANGTQTAVDPYLKEHFGDHPERPWTDDMIGRGCAYIILTSRYHKKLYQATGRPTVIIEPSLTKLYDPRKDVAMGGTGAHTWSDPSTYEGSDNPAVMIYNIIKGIHFVDELGAIEWVYGGQNVAGYTLPTSNWVAAMNACDALVTLKDGTQEKAFRAGYEIRGDVEPLDAIDELLKVCSGRITEDGGKFKIVVGVPGAAVMSITDNDVIVTRERDYKPFPMLANTYNGIEATYPEPIEMWGTKDAPPRYSSVWEVADGRRLATGIQFIACPFQYQVQRLMRAMIEEDRRFAIHVFGLPPETWVLDPLDVISWSSDRNGYVEKDFLVVRIDGEPGMNQVVTLKEIDPSDYDWSSDFELPTDPVPVVPPPKPEQGIEQWGAEGVIIEGDDGSKRAGILLKWDGFDQDGVDRVLYEVRLKATQAVIGSGNTHDVAAGQLPISENIERKTTYEVRGCFEGLPTIDYLWSSWLEVTTPDVPIVNVPADLAPEAVDYSAISQEMKGAVDARIYWLSYAGDLRDRVEQLAAQQTNSDLDARERIDWVFHKTDYGLAVATREMKALSTEQTSLASIVDTVYAEIYDPGGLKDDVAGNASAVDVLEAKVEIIDIDVTETVQLGSPPNKLYLSTGSHVDDYYNGAPIQFTDGPQVGWASTVTDSDGSGTYPILTLADNLPSTAGLNGTHVAIGMKGVIKATSTAMTTVQTSVGTNTSSITEMLQSVDGSKAKYVLVGEVNSITFGFTVTGAVGIDGSVSRGIAFSADTIQIADFNNYARNGSFDRNGAAVNPSGAQDIQGWYISSGVTLLDVLKKGTGVPAGTPQDYVLRLNRNNSFKIWNQMDPSLDGAEMFGVPVKNGDVLRVKLSATTSSASSATSPTIRLAVLKPDGTIAYQNKTITEDDPTPNSSYTFTAQASDGWMSRARDFGIIDNGRAFLLIENASNSLVNWYYTQIEMFRRNGAELIVDGSIVTELVNGQAITDTLYTEVLSSPSNDVEGDGTWKSVLVGNVQFVIPYGYDGWIVVKALFGQDFPGGTGWDSYLEVLGPSSIISGGSETGPSYGAAFAQATSNCFMAIPITGTGSGFGITIKLWWKGSTSNVILKSRQLEACIRKR